MTRRIIATITAALLALALMPAPAFANVVATAALAEANRDVFPGDGQSFSVSVTNGTGLGTLGLGGQRIDYVSIIVPGSRGFRFSNTDFPPPQGWFRTIISEGTSQEVVYKPHPGNGIGAGRTQAFQFPLDVLAPPSSDRSGRFAVGVSSNSGHSISMATAAPPGALDSVIRVLQVLDGRVIAPALASNGTASAGQAVTYGVTVTNYAQNTVTDVSASLTPESGDSVTSTPPPSDIAGGASHTFPFGVTFRGRTQDGTSDFLASASSPNSSAASKRFSYGVQVPPFLEFHESTFQPRSVQPASNDPDDPLKYSFTADFTKRNNPGLTILSDSDDGTSTLSFADTVAELAPDQSFGAAGDRQTVATRLTAVDGEDGDYPVEYDITAMDGNGHVFPLEIRSTEALVSIDALAPVIENLQTILPNGQTMAKNGDTIRVTGEVKDRTAKPEGLSVTLREVGTKTIEPDSVNTTTTANGYTFEAIFRPTFDGDEGDFRADVTAVDDAGNTGSATGELFGIDNIVPKLAAEGYAIDHPVTGEIVIQVVFEENNLIRGGCDTRLYRVGGQTFQPRAVHYSDGSPCQSGQAGPAGEDEDGNANATNTRLLLLQSPPSSRDYQSWVEYDPDRLLASDRVRDPANNRAAEGVQDIVARIVPPLPELTQFKRNQGEENAVFDEDAYWTRFGGSDFTVQVGNVVSNERVEVLDENNNVLAEAPYSDGGSVTTTVPIGTTEGVYTRGVRLVNITHDLEGPIKWIDIALDTTAPAIDSAIRQGADSDQVVVTFTDVVWDGSNGAANWRAFEDDEDGDGPARMAVTDARGARETRTLTVDFQDYGPFIGVEYRLLLGDNYVDRAGNKLASPLFHEGSTAQ